MNLSQIPHYAILSGLFGTAASVFGKFISYSDEVIANLTIDASQNVCVQIVCFRRGFGLIPYSVDAFSIGISLEMVVQNRLHHFNGIL